MFFIFEAICLCWSSPIAPPPESDFDSVLKMGRVFSQICGRLPSLEGVGSSVSDTSGAGSGVDLSHLLTNTKKLKTIRYHNMEGGQSQQPFFNLLRQADALETLYLCDVESTFSRDRQQALTKTISHNYNITTVVINDEAHDLNIASITSHCTRNRTFLESWEDLTVDIHPPLFHLADDRSQVPAGKSSVVRTVVQASTETRLSIGSCLPSSLLAERQQPKSNLVQL
jgi:hypothetical protein